MVLIPFITRTLRPVAIRGVGCVVWCGSCQDTGRSDDADALSFLWRLACRELFGRWSLGLDYLFFQVHFINLISNNDELQRQRREGNRWQS